jgi:hypothetical protein
MHALRSLLLAVVLLPSGFALAQSSSPTLQNLLTEAEWKRAGLDRLTPDEIGVIDAALIRHHRSLAAANTGSSAAEAPAATSRSWRDRFGLGGRDEPHWRDAPPLEATVTRWLGGNRFELDNDQVWEGIQGIPYELPGRSVSIHARPGSTYALAIDGKMTNVRIRRVK